METILTGSETNLIIAALLITSLKYEGNKEHPHEAKKYKDLETKLRLLCYTENKTITIS